MGNVCAALQLFALMMTDHIMRGAGTCRANSSGFKSDDLQLLKDAKRRECERLVGNRMGIVITIFLDSNNRQNASTMMKSGSSIV